MHMCIHVHAHVHVIWADFLVPAAFPAVYRAARQAAPRTRCGATVIAGSRMSAEPPGERDHASRLSPDPRHGEADKPHRPLRRRAAGSETPRPQRGRRCLATLAGRSARLCCLVRMLK